MNSTLIREPVRARGSTVPSIRASAPGVGNGAGVGAANGEHLCDSGSRPTDRGPSGGQSGRPWRRLAAVVAGGVAFLGIASLIKPDPRVASADESGAMPFHSTAQTPGMAAGAHTGEPGGIPRDVAAELARRAHPKGWRVLGALESTDHIVLVYASAEGPRYSVFTAQGRLITADLAAGDVYREVPDLDLSTLRDLPASDGKALMLATPVE